MHDARNYYIQFAGLRLHISELMGKTLLWSDFGPFLPWSPPQNEGNVFLIIINALLSLVRASYLAKRTRCNIFDIRSTSLASIFVLYTCIVNSAVILRQVKLSNWRPIFFLVQRLVHAARRTARYLTPPCSAPILELAPWNRIANILYLSHT